MNSPASKLPDARSASSLRSAQRMVSAIATISWSSSIARDTDQRERRQKPLLTWEVAGFVVLDRAPHQSTSTRRIAGISAEPSRWRVAKVASLKDA